MDFTLSLLVLFFGRSDKPEHHRVCIDNFVIDSVKGNSCLGVGPIY